jgi:topoisomerase (DNA) II binding protein 1
MNAQSKQSVCDAWIYYIYIYNSFLQMLKLLNTYIREIRTKSHVDSAVHAPSGGPTVSASNVVGATGKHLSTPEQFMKAHNASKKSSNIRTDLGTAPDTKCAAMYVDNDTLN